MSNDEHPAEVPLDTPGLTEETFEPPPPLLNFHDDHETEQLFQQNEPLQDHETSEETTPYQQPVEETPIPPPPPPQEKAPPSATELPSFQKAAAPKDPEPTASNLPVNKNSKKILVAYNPVWWFLTILGQMPFRIVKRGSSGFVTYNLQFRKASVPMIIYGSCFLIYAIFYLLITTGIVFFFVRGYSDIKYEIYDRIIKANVFVSLEKEFIRVGLIPMMVMWSLMTVTFMGFITVFVKGGDFVQYFNHWNRVVQVIDIDPTLGVRRFFIIENAIAMCVVFVLTADFFSAFVFKQNQLQQGQGFDRPAALANMVTGMILNRFFDPNEDNDGKYFFLVAFIIMTYGIIASRCQIVAFLFFSQLLRNACEIWNERFRNLLRGDAVILNQTKQSNRRISYAQLLKDHLILVQLFKMTDVTFAIPLMSYYMMNVFSIILEIYFLVDVLLRPLTSKNAFTVVKWNRTLEKFVRIQKLDSDPGSLDEEIQPYGSGADLEQEGAFSFAIIAMLMIYQVFYTLQLTSVAAKAYEQAMKGFSILRRYGFMHCKSATERNFIHTLSMSFAPNNPMRLTGGGYFSLDKALIAGLLANIINFVVFMHQFKPDDWGDMEYNWEQTTR